METQRDVALVTGTSSGIGLRTAIGLARTGLTVVATMRDLQRAGALCEAAAEAGVEVEVRPLEVTDATSARACVDGVLADHGSVDVLVNNAGRGAVATLEQLTDEELQEQLDVNYLERTAGAFANAQTPEHAAAVIVEAATTDQPKFRWQTSEGAATFAGLSLADLDGGRVLGYTSTWIT